MNCRHLKTARSFTEHAHDQHAVLPELPPQDKPWINANAIADNRAAAEQTMSEQEEAKFPKNTRSLLQKLKKPVLTTQRANRVLRVNRMLKTCTTKQ